jgi:hypothetical protein
MILVTKLVAFAAVWALSLPGPSGLPAGPGPQQPAGPVGLLPVLAGWHSAEEPRTFRPDNLYEYIDGGAEAYLGYDFKELAVGQYAADGSKATATVEIYDMGTPLNAFGIYGAERYPESRFLDLGSQGYAEEGVVNFLHGRYYVKILGFDLAGDGTATLLEFARDIIGRSSAEPEGLPPLLGALPRRDLVANSEKYILRNVLGFVFLHDGYLASYSRSGVSYDGFIAAASSPPEAASALGRYLDFQVRNRWTQSAIGADVRLAGPSGDLQYLGLQGRFVFGLIRGRGVGDADGRAFLDDLRKALKAE